MALSVITGRVGQKGTQLLTEGRFSHFTGGVIEKEREFTGGVYPRELRAVGEEQFPLWSEMFLEKQGMSLASCIRSKKPYPMKAAVCFGVNHMMYPESREFLRQLASLDFVLADDLFWTQTCEIADLVLPACSSFERSQVLCYDDRYLFYTSPVIEPLFESKDDVEIIRLLAQKLCPQDKLLCAGYDHCMRYMLDAVVEDWEAFRSLDTPMEITMQNDEDAGGGQIVRVHTSTKKIELYSQTVARIEGLDPLPRYIPPLAATEEYPLIMSSGARIPNAINSRLHKCRWPRALRADILVDIHPQDARQLGIVQGDKVRIITEVGSICVKANITTVTNIGEVQIFEGYERANINDILPEGSLDNYTGFPSYKQFPVRVEQVGKETTI